jgi:hypothetical protein
MNAMFAKGEISFRTICCTSHCESRVKHLFCHSKSRGQLTGFESEWKTTKIIDENPMKLELSFHVSVRVSPC